MRRSIRSASDSERPQAVARPVTVNAAMNKHPTRHRRPRTELAIPLAVALTSAAALAPAVAAEPGTGERATLDRELSRLYADTGLNPFDAVGANNHAMKLVARGDYERALKLLRRAARLAPGRPDIARNLGHVQRLVEQRTLLSERSRAHLRDSFAPIDVPPAVAGAWTTTRGERPRSVEAATDTAPRPLDNPFEPTWLVERAALKSRRGEHRAALADLERARTLDPHLSGVDDEIARLQRLLPDGGERVRPIPPRPSGAGGIGDGDSEIPRPWSIGVGTAARGAGS